MKGDISGSIVINASAVNTAIVGSYPVTYNVTDSNGNPAVQVTRTVEVVDSLPPVITLLALTPLLLTFSSILFSSAHARKLAWISMLGVCLAS